MTGSTSGSKIPAGYKQGTMQNFTPEQMQLFKSMFSQLGPDSYLAKLAGGDQSMFEEMEKPAMKQFGEFQGQLASRFSGMGMGSRRGSGFQNAMTQGAADFAESLQAKRLEMRNQALQDLMGFSNQLLGQKPYENFLIEKQQKQSGWGGLIGAGVGGAGGFFLGGPAGALKGAGLGYNVGSGF
jgi:hypothetical protein